MSKNSGNIRDATVWLETCRSLAGEALRMGSMLNCNNWNA